MTVIDPRALIEDPDPACQGKCKGDRSSTESPAVIYNGRPACPCCGYYLRRSPVEEVNRPPNLNPELADTSIRFLDDICKYDVVLLRELKERG